MNHLLLRGFFLLFILGTSHAVIAQQQVVSLKLASEDEIPFLDSLRRGKVAGMAGGPAATVVYERIFRNAGKHETKHRKYGLHLWYRVKYNSAVVNEDRLFTALRSRVTRIEKNGYEAQDTRYPADSLFPLQWNFDNTGQLRARAGSDLSLINAHRLERGRKEVVISIHDSGLDTLHRDLVSNLWTNLNEIPDNNIDDDNNGYVDDVHGWNFADRNNVLHDTDGHGTHVAGIIAAKADDHGIIGIAGGNTPDNGVRLMICRVDSYFPGLTINNPEESIIYAADNGAIISQNSWNTYSRSYSVKAAIDYFAAEANNDMLSGGVVVFSAGNHGLLEPRYENENPRVIMVGNIDRQDKLHPYSNHGTWLDLCAPGTEVLSAHLEGGYKEMSGTSMAAPHVSGVAGLVASHFGNPAFSPDSLIKKVIASGENIDAFNTIYLAGRLGSGRVNAFRALAVDDHTGPAPVDEIAVGNVRSQDIHLRWVAPFDSLLAPFRYQIIWEEGSGTPASGQAQEIVHALRQPYAGDTLELTITGLKPATEYIFTIRAIDYFGNVSAPSLPVSVTTKGAPILSIENYRDEHTFAIDSAYQTTFNIRNTGPGELDWKIVTRHPDSLAFAGIQVQSSNYFTYYELNQFLVQRGAQVSEFGTETSSFDLVNVQLLILDDQINLMDTARYQVIVDWVERGGSLIFMFDGWSEMRHSSRLAEAFGATFEFYHEDHVQVVEQSGTHVLLDSIWKMRLWAYANHIVPADGTGIPGFEPVLKDHLGNVHAIAGQYGKGRVIIAANRILQSYSIYDEDNYRFATNAIRWLSENVLASFEPSYATTVANGSTQVHLTFNRNQAPYTAGQFYVLSNDPDHPRTTLQYYLLIEGKGEMTVMHDTIRFDTTFTGYATHKMLGIGNRGNDTLRVHIDGSSNEFFSIHDHIDLAPGDIDSVVVRFSPSAEQNYTARLFLVGADGDTASVCVTGTGLHPPSLTHSPHDTLRVVVPIGETAEKMLYVRNTGKSNLKTSFMLFDEDPPSDAERAVAFSGKHIAFNNLPFHTSYLSQIDWGPNSFHHLRSFMSQNNFSIDTVDLLVVDQTLYNYSNEEIAGIREWVRNGGSLVLQLENVYAPKLAVLTHETILRSVAGYSVGLTDTLSQLRLHPVRDGIGFISSSNYTNYLKTDKPFQTIVLDRYDNVHVAWDTIGAGKILMIANKLVNLEATQPNNRGFLVQAFNWLLSDKPHWISVGSDEALVPPGELTAFKFKFVNEEGRDRVARLAITSNDPARMYSSVMVHMQTSVATNPYNFLPEILQDTFRIGENSTHGSVFGAARAVDENGDLISWFTNDLHVAIDGATGTLSVNDSAVFDFESHPLLSVTVHATDGIDTVSRELPLRVLNLNERPALDQTPALAVDEDTRIAHLVSYMDPEGDDALLSVVVPDTTLFSQHPIAFVPGTDSLVIHADENEHGQALIRIFADDGAFIDSIDVTLNIMPVNDAPALAPIADIEIDNDTLLLNLTVTDPDDNDITIRIEAADTLIVRDTEFGISKSSITHSSISAIRLRKNGTTTVSVSATDGMLFSQQDFTLNVSGIVSIENGTGHDVRVYPNPASGHVTIEKKSDQIRAVTITDISGHAVCQWIGRTTQAQVSLEDLAAGIYLIEIACEDGTFLFRKLVVK